MKVRVPIFQVPADIPGGVLFPVEVDACLAVTVAGVHHVGQLRDQGLFPRGEGGHAVVAAPRGPQATVVGSPILAEGEVAQGGISR